METLIEYAANLPGYLGMEFAKEIQPDGRVFGLSAVYWKTLEDLDAWRKDMRHMQAKQKGKSSWYDEHNIKVCHVLSHYGSNLTQGHSKKLAYKNELTEK